jgi:hypothetical protein
VDQWRADTGSLGHDIVLAGARPQAALRHESSLVGAEKREESTGNSSRASLELGWRCGGQAMVVKRRWKWSSGATVHKLGERERMVRGDPAGAAPFYRCCRVVQGGGGQ